MIESARRSYSPPSALRRGTTMSRRRFPMYKLAAFALLNVCDFAITYVLLTQQSGTVYESNPIAHHTLAQGGWAGLALFKAAIVAFVIGVAVFVYRRRPRAAHGLLTISCVAVMFAVLTGASIAASARAKSADESELLIVEDEEVVPESIAPTPPPRIRRVPPRPTALAAPGASGPAPGTWRHRERRD
jgi:hypothetical protein